LVSAKGPSVVLSLPFRNRTVVAVCTGCSASPWTMWPLFWISSVNAKYSPMNLSDSLWDIAPTFFSSS
jgi:hypothetical protein